MGNKPQASPQSGRIIKEDGSPINRADAYYIDIDGNMRLRTDAKLEAGDIQIGAVEIKDATTADRSKVKAGNTMLVDDPALAVSDPNVKAEITAVKTQTDKLKFDGEDLKVKGAVTTDVETGLAKDATLTNASQKTQIVDDLGATITSFGSPSTIADYKSPSNFTATFTSNVTLTLSALSGFSITDSSQLVYIKVIPVTGDAQVLVNGSGGVSMRISSNVITVSGAGTPFASGDVYEVGINALPFEKDPSTQSIKTSQLNMLNNYVVNETLLNTTNLAAGTTYYPSATGMSMDGFKDLDVSGRLIDADGTITFTVEASNNPDPATAVFHQIYGYDCSNNAVVNTQTVTNGTNEYYMSFDNLNCNLVRVKIVNDGATNTISVFSRRKAL